MVVVFSVEKGVVAVLLLCGLLLMGSKVGVAQEAPVTAALAEAPVQPIPFSHKKHTNDMHLPCQFCHTKPDPGVQMTLPPTRICMGCHASIAVDKPAIKKLAEFHNAGKPVPWVQVYSVPGFVFWSHDTHLQAKVECSSCHGDVTQMDTISEVTNVTQMAGCVSCHKERNAPTGCMVCHEVQTSRLLLTPLPAILRKIIQSQDGM